MYERKQEGRSGDHHNVLFVYSYFRGSKKKKAISSCLCNGKSCNNIYLTNMYANITVNREYTLLESTVVCFSDQPLKVSLRWLPFPERIIALVFLTTIKATVLIYLPYSASTKVANE